MKKLILPLVLVLVMGINVFADESSDQEAGYSWFDISGYAAVKYIDTSTQDGVQYKFPGQENWPQDGVEAGILFGAELADHLDFRSYLKYEPGHKDDEPVSFETFMLDVYDTVSDYTYGLRLGRQIFSYGFYGDTRTNPAYSHTIINISTNMWQFNRALWDYGDGYIGHLNGSFGIFTFVMEAGNLVHNDPQPETDYNRGAPGVDQNRVDLNRMFHLSLEAGSKEAGLHTLRYSRIHPEQWFEISDEHYTEQGYPSGLGLTGDFSKKYELEYLGYRVWYGDLSFMFSRILWTDTAEGQREEEYYAQFNLTTERNTETLYHANITYHFNNTDLVYFEYGESRGGDTGEEWNRGRDYTLGTKIDFGAYGIAKFQYSQADNLRNIPIHGNEEHLSSFENSNREDLPRNWSLWAAQYVYPF